jgi:GST-like protein
MIDVHYWPTPNGRKVTILLEECDLEYRIVQCSIGQGDQFTDDFLSISPNNRMPAIVDHDPADGGKPIAIFESGAIMMYIAEKAGQFYPQDLRGRYEVNQWLIWQMANQGPKSGESGHFRGLGDEQGENLDDFPYLKRSFDKLSERPGVERRMAVGSEFSVD